MTYEAQQEKESRIKSAILTIVFTSLVFLFLYFYKLYSTPVFPPYKEIAIDFSEEQLTLEEASKIPIEKEIKSSSASAPEEPAPLKTQPKVEEKVVEKKNEPKEIKTKPILTEEKKENIPVIKKTDTKKEDKKEDNIKKAVEKTEKKSAEKVKENNTKAKSETKPSEKTSPSDGKGKSLADLLVKGKGKGTSGSSVTQTNGTSNQGENSLTSSVKTVYAYLGYYNVCHLGGEIKNPGKNIPKSIFISIIGIATLYLLMNISVMGVMPWQSVKEGDRYLVSSFMEQLYDHQAGIIVTVLILCIAFSSLFAVVLGYSRVPYAAAVDGNFFKPFAKLHPTKNFPYISLIVLCALGFVFSLFMRLGDVISSILAMRIIVQFIGQGVGVVLLRKKFGTEGLPFKMWLFPVPIILSVAIWIFLFISTGWFALWGSFIAVVGVVVYSVKARLATNQNL